MVTGLVRKDADSVIPAIIDVLSKGNFGQYVLIVAYLGDHCTTPLWFWDTNVLVCNLLYHYIVA